MAFGRDELYREIFQRYTGEIILDTGWWLSPTPLKNMSSSIGMMTFPIEWKNETHVPVTTNQILYIMWINRTKIPPITGDLPTSDSWDDPPSITGWWYTYPEKNMIQLGLLFQI